MSKGFIGAIAKISQAIDKNRDFLTDLDQAIGDGDHGINMSRGFKAVMAKLNMEQNIDISAGLKKTAMTLLSSVGGASGPLYGTAFMRAAVPAAGKNEITREVAVQLLGAALAGIKERGKAVRGEKTMVDSMEPAYEAFLRGIDEDRSLGECLELACEAAREGVEYTKGIIATKGRASYLGERSIGYQDPGATSVLIILEALRDYYNENQ